MESRKLFSLGKLYPSDFLKPDESPRCEPVELNLIMDEEGFVRLEQFAPNEVMWGKYWYQSSVTGIMRNELKNIVESIISLMKFDKGDTFCDVACNDGTLLSYVPNYFCKIGVDPADDSFKRKAEKHADFIIQDYFSAAGYKNSVYGNQKINCLTSIAMFYDLDNPKQFIKDVYEVLDDNGLWVMQLSYSPLMIYQTAFDNICHEHKYYYWLTGLINLLGANGFEVVDSQLNETNGGSIRLYIMKDIGDKRKFGTQSHRDVAKFRIGSLIEFESVLRISEEATWEGFFNCIVGLKEKVVSFITNAKKEGKSVWGYGASTKGNTLLQYFGLDNTLIDGIAEKSQEKWGLRTVGTNIPIYSEEDMRKAKPNYLLILPWHFVSEFKEREVSLLWSGTKFILPCPNFEIIGYD